MPSVVGMAGSWCLGWSGAGGMGDVGRVGRGQVGLHEDFGASFEHLRRL